MSGTEKKDVEMIDTTTSNKKPQKEEEKKEEPFDPFFGKIYFNNERY